MDHTDTAQRMAEAADNFLASLDAARRQKAVIDFADSTERETGTTFRGSALDCR